MKTTKRVTQAFWVINILILIIGFCGVAGAQDQQTVKKLQQLIEQQQKQLEAQQKALRDLKNRVETLTTEEAVVEVQAAQAERLAEEAVKKAQEAKAEADRAHREAIAVDVEMEEDLHRSKGKSFHIPDTKTVLTLSGFIKADVIHDFDKIQSPYKFVAKDIVVRRPTIRPAEQPDNAHRQRFPFYRRYCDADGLRQALDLPFL